MTCEKIRWPIRADVRALGCGFPRTAPKRRVWEEDPSEYINFWACVGVRVMPVFSFEKEADELLIMFFDGCLLGR